MNPNLQITLSMILTFGIPLAFAIYELVSVRRPPGGRWDPGPEPRRPAPPPLPDLAPPQPRTPARLPDCLIPRPLPAGDVRARELEPV